MRSSTGSGESTSPTKADSATLSQFRAAYKKADDFCKEVQSFAAEAGIPAMNELRYAGHHLIESMCDEGKVVAPDQLVKATNHARRACYEAGEAGILFALDKIDEFKKDYKSISVSGVVKNYTDILNAADAAKDRVVAERNHVDDGDTDHNDFITHFKELAGHCRILDLARDELNKLVKNERTVARRWVIGIGIAVAALFVGAGSFAVNAAKAFAPTPSPASPQAAPTPSPKGPTKLGSGR